MNWGIATRCGAIALYILSFLFAVEFGRATAQPNTRWINAETVKASNLLIQNGLVLRFPADSAKVEFGLREDQVVVWRDSK